MWVPGMTRRERLQSPTLSHAYTHHDSRSCYDYDPSITMPSQSTLRIRRSIAVAKGWMVLFHAPVSYDSYPRFNDGVSNHCNNQVEGKGETYFNSSLLLIFKIM
jgi:hypothetical protein